jgi:hypothetical protein
VANITYNVIDTYKVTGGLEPTWRELPAAVRQELSSGVLALRAVSLTVAFSAIRSLLAILRLPIFVSSFESPKPLYDFPEEKDLQLDIELKVYRNRAAHMFLNVVQNGFYLAGVILLWIANISGFNLLSVALLSWVLLYVVDDWRIVFRYSLALKGRILPHHGRFFKLSNIGIASCALVAAWQMSWIACAVYFSCVIIIGFLLRLLADGEASGLDIIDAINWRWWQKDRDPYTGTISDPITATPSERD